MKAKARRPQPALHAHLRHLLVPNERNSFRPHLIRLHGIIAILTIALASQVIYNIVTTGKLAVLGSSAEITLTSLAQDTNTQRANASLQPLKLNQKLDQAAYDKAQDMFKNNYWAHVSPSGVQPWVWINNTGYNYDTAGENLAKNYPSTQATVAAWMASPGHKANILNKTYTDVGFAVASGSLQGKTTTVVVAYYASPASVAVNGAVTNNNSTFAQIQTLDGNVLSYIGGAIEAINPATLGALVLFGLGFVVALASYRYRNQLPKHLRKTWRAHHGAYKAAGFAIVSVLFVAATTSIGQI